MICFIFFRKLFEISPRCYQIGSIKRNRKHEIKRINCPFFSPFFSRQNSEVDGFSVETFLNCMTNARRLLFDAFVCHPFDYHESSPFLPQKLIFFSLPRIHSYAKKEDRSKSTMTYLFCVRPLFLFAYTPLEKTLS